MPVVSLAMPPFILTAGKPGCALPNGRRDLGWIDEKTGP